MASPAERAVVMMRALRIDDQVVRDAGRRK